MLSEEDTLFADDIKAEGLGLRVVKGLGLRVVKGLGVVLAVVGLGLGLGVNRLLFEFLMGRRVVAGRRVVVGRLVVVVVVVVVLFVVVLLGGGGLRVVVVVMGLLVGLGLATAVVFLAAQRPGYDPEQDVPDGHLVQAFPCLYISPPM